MQCNCICKHFIMLVSLTLLSMICTFQPITPSKPGPYWLHSFMVRTTNFVAINFHTLPLYFPALTRIIENTCDLMLCTVNPHRTVSLIEVPRYSTSYASPDQR
ncbi:hypothetical protein F4677DRAFT_27916 [Hypoxylon crocopeplum]|nr:hypothetical protein F4677DRAFT_27916 [Hypoxylon crocopeplum]